MVNATSSNRRGLIDWLVQRFSAVFMLLVLVGLLVFLLCHPNLTYSEWYGFFAHPIIKITTILFFISVLLHAWVGMWTVFTDYIKNGFLRIFLQAFVILLLGSFFFSAMLIFWGL